MEARAPHIEARGEELLLEIYAEVISLRREVAELRAARAPAAEDGPEPEWEAKPYYTYDEAASVLGVGKRTIEGWVSAKKVLTIYVNGPRIPHDELVRIWRKGVGRKKVAKRPTRAQVQR